nr:MAG TPA: hypothetical protein [Caudoviricetes sp.]
MDRTPSQILWRLLLLLSFFFFLSFHNFIIHLMTILYMITIFLSRIIYSLFDFFHCCMI